MGGDRLPQPSGEAELARVSVPVPGEGRGILARPGGHRRCARHGSRLSPGQPRCRRLDLWLGLGLGGGPCLVRRRGLDGSGDAIGTGIGTLGGVTLGGVALGGVADMRVSGLIAGSSGRFPRSGIGSLRPVFGRRSGTRGQDRPPPVVHRPGLSRGQRMGGAASRGPISHPTAALGRRP